MTICLNIEKSKALNKKSHEERPRCLSCQKEMLSPIKKTTMVFLFFSELGSSEFVQVKILNKSPKKMANGHLLPYEFERITFIALKKYSIYFSCQRKNFYKEMFLFQAKIDTASYTAWKDLNMLNCLSCLILCLHLFD